MASGHATFSQVAVVRSGTCPNIGPTPREAPHDRESGRGHDGLLQLPCAIPGPRRCLCPTCGQVLNAPQVPSWAQFAATAPIQEKSGIDRVSAFEAVRISQTSSQKQDYGSTTLALFFHQVYRAARLSPRSKACNRTLVAGSDCSIQVMRSPLLSLAS